MDVRASDADRDAAAAVLRDAVARGALTLPELEGRLDRVYRSTWQRELTTVTADVRPSVIPPPAPAGGVPARLVRSAGFRYHSAAYGLTNGFLVGTWGLTGAGFFWPFFPAAGWGIGLGMHAVAVISRQDRRQATAERRALAASLPAAAATRRTDERRRSGRVDHRSRRAPAALPVAADLPLPLAHGRSPQAARRSSAPRESAAPRVQEPTAPAPAAARFVAVLFTDIVGSTTLNEAMGDAGWVALRAEHRKLLRTCFDRNGGIEVSSQGDGFLARFDHPRKAVACAIDIQRSLATDRRVDPLTPEVRIGVHCGDAVEEDGDLLGHVINVAARLTGAAAAGEIIVSESVADHAEAEAPVEDRGVQTLRGVSRPRHLLAVRW